MKKILCVLIILITAHSLFSAEFSDGRVKLVVNERTGRFSLYYMADLAAEEYLPFFVDGDPRTSFLSIMVNNRNYKMGESSMFKTMLGGSPKNPALVFESSFFIVTEQFSFVKTGTSEESNGVTITITVTNKSGQDVEAGIRFLVDTILGEADTAHFLTSAREIDSETSIDKSSADQYWVSKNRRLSLVGSIGQNIDAPDEILFSNWKRLHDAAWKPAAMPGRNFNMLPYSIDDSAVCYFYEPARISQGESRTVSLTLSGGNGDFSTQNTVPHPQITANTAAENGEKTAVSIQDDLIVVRDLLALLEAYDLAKTEVSNEELEAAGLLISRIKSKYSIP